MKRQKNQITRIVPGAEKLTIEALDGKLRIADAKNVFKSYIDPDFKSSELDQYGPATPKMSVTVREIIENATFMQMFTSIGRKLSKLVMTQAQIINFCEKHGDHLCQEGSSTFFLTETKLNFSQKLYRFLFDRKFGYYVTHVYVSSDGLDVNVNRLEDDCVWRDGPRRRLVSPQLDF